MPGVNSGDARGGLRGCQGGFGARRMPGVGSGGARGDLGAHGVGAGWDAAVRDARSLPQH